MAFTDAPHLVYPLARIEGNVFVALGTAFLCEKQGFFVSAAHEIVDNEKKLAVIINGINSIQEYQDTSLNNRICMPVEVVEFDPIHDICILKSALPIASNLSISSFDATQVGDSVVLFGYPHCNYGRLVLTQQNANIGAKILIERNGIKMKNIVLNIQSRPGQSGSPIIHGRDIVGMLIGSYAPSGGGGISLGGVDPHTLHQTTHAISAEYIKEML